MPYPPQPQPGGPSQPYEPWYPFRRRRRWWVPVVRGLATIALVGVVLAVAVGAFLVVFRAW